MNLKRLKDLREDNDFTQAEFAEKIDCNPNTYSSWENGYALIPITYFDKISCFYNVSFKYLLGNVKSHKRGVPLRKLDITILRNNMKQERKKKSLTQGEIAKILEIGKTTYHDYETGKYDIKLDKLVMLVDYYKIDIDVFCGKIKEQ